MSLAERREGAAAFAIARAGMRFLLATAGKLHYMASHQRLIALHRSGEESV